MYSRVNKRYIKIRYYREVRRCRFCEYVGDDWPDSDECPACGEIN